jgi:uncharacterized protein YqeY
MPSMIERVEADRRAARRARDEEGVTALGLLLAALRDAAKTAGPGFSEADAEAVLRRERKRRSEAAASFREGGRAEEAAREDAELERIERYLPEELSEAELERLVDDAVAESGATSQRDLGAVMKLAMARAGGRADGAALARLVRSRLAG